MAPPVDWLTAEDARILALEGPVVAGHTCKVIELAPDGPAFSLDDLRSQIAGRLHAAPRLRRRLEPEAAPRRQPAWVEDERFDISHHVLELPLGGPVDREGLRDVVAGLMHARLDRSRPLWTVHVVPELTDGGAALVLRIHHAVADGAAALRVCSHVLWDEDEAKGDGASAPAAPPRTRADTSSPPRHRRSVVRELRPGSGRSPLGARISARRSVAFAGAELADIQTVARSQEERATVNDVVLCVVSGGLRRGLFEDARAPRLRAKVPVSLHRPDEGDVANRDSFMCVDLDVAEADPLRRLAAIRRGTEERKLGGDADVLDELLRGDSRRRRVIGRLARRWSMSPRVFALNVSNVRGPAGALTVLDKPVRAVYSLAEVAERHALRVACISTSGRLTFGLCADAAAVARLDAIAAGIEDELEDLVDRLAGAARSG